MPSRMPICDPNPKDNSIEKNKKLQKGEPGSLVNASAITMNASPEMETRNFFFILLIWINVLGGMYYSIVRPLKEKLRYVNDCALK